MQYLSDVLAIGLTASTKTRDVTPGENMTPGEIETPVKIVTPGKTVTPGEIVTPGKTVTPGKIVTPGEVVTSWELFEGNESTQNPDEFTTMERGPEMTSTPPVAMGTTSRTTSGRSTVVI